MFDDFDDDLLPEIKAALLRSKKDMEQVTSADADNNTSATVTNTKANSKTKTKTKAKTIANSKLHTKAKVSSSLSSFYSSATEHHQNTTLKQVSPIAHATQDIASSSALKNNTTSSQSHQASLNTCNTLAQTTTSNSSTFNKNHKSRAEEISNSFELSTVASASTKKRAKAPTLIDAFVKTPNAAIKNPNAHDKSFSSYSSYIDRAVDFVHAHHHQQAKSKQQGLNTHLDDTNSLFSEIDGIAASYAVPLVQELDYSSLNSFHLKNVQEEATHSRQDVIKEDNALITKRSTSSPSKTSSSPDVYQQKYSASTISNTHTPSKTLASSKQEKSQDIQDHYKLLDELQDSLSSKSHAKFYAKAISQDKLKASLELAKQAQETDFEIVEGLDEEQIVAQIEFWQNYLAKVQAHKHKEQKHTKKLSKHKDPLKLIDITQQEDNLEGTEVTKSSATISSLHQSLSKDCSSSEQDMDLFNKQHNTRAGVANAHASSSQEHASINSESEDFQSDLVATFMKVQQAQYEEYMKSKSKKETELAKDNSSTKVSSNSSSSNTSDNSSFAEQNITYDLENKEAIATMTTVATTDQDEMDFRGKRAKDFTDEEREVFASQVKEHVDNVFAQGGVLSQKLPQYSPRQGQIEVAQAVGRAMSTGSFLMVEAGTGTGKTFSYLVPPLMMDKRVAVSTGTKALQDQLISKDIPWLLEMLDTPYKKHMALKGQSNYVCRYLFEEASLADFDVKNYNRLHAIVNQCIDDLDHNFHKSDFAELRLRLSETERLHCSCDSRVCRHLAINCPYSKDKSKGDKRNKVSGEMCFIKAARTAARYCDVVAVNHALYVANMNISDEAQRGSIVPDTDVVVFDEAHTLPEVARGMFTRHYTVRSLKEIPDEVSRLIRDGKVLHVSHDFRERLQQFKQAVDCLNEFFNSLQVDKYLISEFKYLHNASTKDPKATEEDFLNLLSQKEQEERKLYQNISSKGGKALANVNANGANGTQGMSLGLNLDLIDDTIVKVDKSKLSDKELDAIEEDAVLDKKLSEALPLGEIRYSARTSRKHARSMSLLLNNAYNVNIEDDYLHDEQGMLVQDPFFRMVMTRLYLLSDKLSRIMHRNIEEQSEVFTPLAQLFDELKSFISDFMNSDRDRNGNKLFNHVGYIEITENNSDLVLTPIDIGRYLGPALRNLKERGITVIFTSATITVNQNFEKFCADVGLGLDEVERLIVDSPFDYAKNACLLYSGTFPEINQNKRIAQSLDMISEIIDHAPGGVFFLTTSYRSLEEASIELMKRFGHKRKILVQGTDTVPHLMEAFKESGMAILVGTSSFWEGVDVPGKALSLVVIDKLPFKTVADPLSVARQELCIANGGNAFMDISLPEAIIMLRQGVGRLIRNESDKGALIILDPRLESKYYGKQFLNSLPPMQKVNTVEKVIKFFKSLKDSN